MNAKTWGKLHLTHPAGSRLCREGGEKDVLVGLRDPLLVKKGTQHPLVTAVPSLPFLPLDPIRPATRREKALPGRRFAPSFMPPLLGSKRAGGQQQREAGGPEGFGVGRFGAGGANRCLSTLNPDADPPCVFCVDAKRKEIPFSLKESVAHQKLEGSSKPKECY